MSKHARHKKRILERDGNNCWLCKLPVIIATQNECYDYRRIIGSVDHVKPKSRGGKRRNDNLRIAHVWCNGRRGASIHTHIDAQGISGKKYIRNILAPLLEVGLITPEQAIEKSPRIVELFPHLLNTERHLEPEARWRDEWAS